jgi:hypothetical protein
MKNGKWSPILKNMIQQKIKSGKKPPKLKWQNQSRYQVISHRKLERRLCRTEVKEGKVYMLYGFYQKI